MSSSIPQENKEQFIRLVSDELEARKWRQFDLANAMGVSPNMISVLVRKGPFDGLRAKDLLKLVEVLNLDIVEVARLLGVQLPTTSESGPAMDVARRIGMLSESQQDWLLGVLDVLLRGLR